MCSSSTFFKIILFAEIFRLLCQLKKNKNQNSVLIKQLQPNKSSFSNKQSWTLSALSPFTLLCIYFIMHYFTRKRHKAESKEGIVQLLGGFTQYFSMLVKLHQLDLLHPPSIPSKFLSHFLYLSSLFYSHSLSLSLSKRPTERIGSLDFCRRTCILCQIQVPPFQSKDTCYSFKTSEVYLPRFQLASFQFLFSSSLCR